MAQSPQQSWWTLIEDDSVRLFNAGRALLGAIIAACAMLAAHLWL